MHRLSRYSILFSLICCLTTSTTHAEGFGDLDPKNNCGCRWQGPFSWIIDSADVIAVVNVSSHRGNSMDANVEQVIKGEERNLQIRIWGDRGHQCRPPLKLFPTQTRWLLALQRIDNIPVGGFDPFHPERSFGRIGDYQLPACGAYWLAVQNDRVTGNITSILDWDYAPEMDPVPITTIKDFIEGKASYADIIGYSNEITSPAAMMRKSKQWLKSQQD